MKETNIHIRVKNIIMIMIGIIMPTIGAEETIEVEGEAAMEEEEAVCYII